MRMELVNGYPCFNCTDVDLAKKGINPAKPQDDPRSPNYDPTSANGANSARGPSSARDGASVTFGGSLTALNSVQPAAEDQTSQSGLPQQQPQWQRPGSTLDITV
jgi:hypothetical protein